MRLALVAVFLFRTGSESGSNASRQQVHGKRKQEAQDTAALADASEQKRQWDWARGTSCWSLPMLQYTEKRKLSVVRRISARGGGGPPGTRPTLAGRSAKGACWSRTVQESGPKLPRFVQYDGQARTPRAVHKPGVGGSLVWHDRGGRPGRMVWHSTILVNPKAG